MTIPLKSGRDLPITGKPMAMIRLAPLAVVLAALLSAAPAWGQERSAAAAAGTAAKPGRPSKAPIPVLRPEEQRETPSPAAPGATAPDAAAGLFEEIEFGGTLVIEGKVEKPQVQFTLLKEPPPEKDIRFEASFLQSILKQERENTFRP